MSIEKRLTQAIKKQTSKYKTNNDFDFTFEFSQKSESNFIPTIT